MEVVHHGVGVVVGGLVLEGLQVIQPEELGLARRVELTMGDVKQRPQRRTAFASLLPRRRPRHLTIYDTIRRVLVVAPDLELPCRRVVAETTVTLHRCTLLATIVRETGPLGAPILPLAPSPALLPFVFHQVLLLARQRQRQAASPARATGRQISSGRSTPRIEHPLGGSRRRLFGPFRTSARHVQVEIAGRWVDRFYSMTLIEHRMYEVR